MPACGIDHKAKNPTAKTNLKSTLRLNPEKDIHAEPVHAPPE
jgi:hypothetical protein